MAEKEIDYVNDEYKRLVKKWKIIDDICNVENVENYIKTLNANDTSLENIERNRLFKENAIFYELASFTRQTLLGLLFKRWPKLNVPKLLEYVEKNVNGEGISIYQLSQMVAKEVIGKGKAGLLVDFPQVDEQPSATDMAELKYISTIHYFKPEQILLPVETITVGGVCVLSRVRLSTSVEENYETIPVIRELLLDNGIYVSREWRSIKEKWEMVNETFVKGGNGQYLNYIPFAFVGSETNTKETNQPPLYGICKINIGHYNNSADYEDSCHTCGVIQPWASGLSMAEIKEMEENGFYFGCGRLIGLGEGGTLGFAQGQPNQIVREAMDKKVNDIVGLGGSFIMPGSAVKTATQSEGEQDTQHSKLSLIASNISEAVTKCLNWVCDFMNISITDDLEYTIFQDFKSYKTDAHMITALSNAITAGHYRKEAFVNWQKKHGIEDEEQNTEEILEELEEQSPKVTMPYFSVEDEG